MYHLCLSAVSASTFFFYSCHTPIELYATITEQRHSLVHGNLLHYVLFLFGWKRLKGEVHTVPSDEVISFVKKLDALSLLLEMLMLHGQMPSQQRPTEFFQNFGGWDLTISSLRRTPSRHDMIVVVFSLLDGFSNVLGCSIWKITAETL